MTCSQRWAVLAVALTCLAGHVEQITCFYGIHCREPYPCRRDMSAPVMWGTDPSVCRAPLDECKEQFRDVSGLWLSVPSNLCLSECVKP